ncbi:MAG: hypothetical protein Q8Q36_01165 [bacterium]|nr:hypothetical protein [bacterium]
MDHLKVIEEIVNQHTSVTGTIVKNGRSLIGAVGGIVDEWHHGATPRKKMHEFPFEHELEHLHKESKQTGKWRFDCVLCDIDVEINPILPKILDKDRSAFLKAIDKLPPLGTPTHEVHWPTLRRELKGGREIEEDLEEDLKYTLRVMALGACYGIWYFDTPHRMGFCGAEAERLARDGLLLIRPLIKPLPKDPESSKLPLFFTARP